MKNTKNLIAVQNNQKTLMNFVLFKSQNFLYFFNERLIIVHILTNEEGDAYATQ